MDRRILERIFDRFMVPADAGVPDDAWLRTDAVCWEPLEWGSPRTLTGPAADMDDPGQVLQQAYEVTFFTTAAPGARIVACTYASQTSEACWKGIRFTYTTAAAPDGFYTAWEGDPYDQAYEGAGSADRAAQELAKLMASDPGWAMATLPGIFEWDGQQFGTAIHAEAGEP
jgi:hypothetical protein